MANIEFTKDSLREAVVKAGNRKIDIAKEALADATDPQRLEERRQEWRTECSERLQRMALKDVITDDDLTEFALPSKPPKADGYSIKRLEEAVETAYDRRERMLTRIEAMNGDVITLTPKQLSDYFGI